MLDFENLDKYRENNRIEAKKAVGGDCPKAFGRHTLLLPIRWVA